MKIFLILIFNYGSFLENYNELSKDILKNISNLNGDWIKKKLSRKIFKKNRKKLIQLVNELSEYDLTKLSKIKNIILHDLINIFSYININYEIIEKTKYLNNCNISVDDFEKLRK